MAWLFIVLSIPLSLTVWWAVSLINNYNLVRQTELPLVVTFINPLNPFWQLLSKPFIPYFPLLPEPFKSLTRFSYVGWQYDDKFKAHQQLGPCFILVSPGMNELVVADPGATETILNDRKAFIKPPFIYTILDIFGKNLNTVNGSDWQRHRKLTAPSFNERISKVVWDESTRQARDMLVRWTTLSTQGTCDTMEDTRIVALHVIDHAGFGITNDFGEGVMKPGPGHQIAYRDAMLLILSNILLVFVLPVHVLSKSFMPKSLQQLGLALREFRTYMEEMVTAEREKSSKNEHGKENLLSTLVRASDEAKSSGDQALSKSSMTDEELYGNIFIYSFAGHETTASTIAYAVVLLAVNPSYQDWIAAELQHVIGEETVADYDKVFPRLRRTLSLMLEVLRLYGPVTALPKSTGDGERALAVNGVTKIIPADTLIAVNLLGLHTNPSTWGQNSLSWCPDRWISRTGRDTKSDLTQSQILDGETIVEPKPGSYIPWADGPRFCPGKKFSQVEFVAVVAVLFRKYRVQPTLNEGESKEQARARLMATVEDSGIREVTLEMRNPKSVRLMWSLRE